MKFISRRVFATATAAAMLALALTGCASGSNSSVANEPESSEPEPEPAAVVMVQDMNGDDAIEAGTAESILTVNSVATQMVLMVGGQDAATTVGAELNANGGAGSDVTTEAIIGADPDIIICENSDLYATIASDAQYADMTAVKNGAVYAALLGTAVWSMGTAEAPLMVYWASQYINPDLYAEIDVNAETVAFFEKFYGYSLSDDELAGVLNR